MYTEVQEGCAEFNISRNFDGSYFDIYKVFSCAAFQQILRPQHNALYSRRITTLLQNS